MQLYNTRSIRLNEGTTLVYGYESDYHRAKSSIWCGLNVVHTGADGGSRTSCINIPSEEAQAFLVEHLPDTHEDIDFITDCDTLLMKKVYAPLYERKTNDVGRGTEFEALDYVCNRYGDRIRDLEESIVEFKRRVSLHRQRQGVLAVEGKVR